MPFKLKIHIFLAYTYTLYYFNELNLTFFPIFFFLKNGVCGIFSGAWYSRTYSNKNVIVANYLNSKFLD